MGDSCGPSILPDCQPLGKGRNSPRDPIIEGNTNRACVRAEGEGTGLSPVALSPHMLVNPDITPPPPPTHHKAAPFIHLSFHFENRLCVKKKTASGCLFSSSLVGGEDPLRPHTSLHSISGVLIWGYKEACPREGQQLDSGLAGHKAPFHSSQVQSSRNNRLKNG